MRTLVCLHDCFVYCTSILLYICIVAPHLGTLAEAREGPDAEPNQRMMFGGSISRMEESSSSYMEWRCSARRCKLT
jgi:hypothetical protein